MDSSRQIPQPAVANRVARRMTRRLFGFGIDNSHYPRVSQAAVADEQSVRSPPYRCMGSGGHRSSEYLPRAI